MQLEKQHPMEKLKHELSRILDVVPRGSKVLFLEYPVYANLGDLFIMKGTEQFFADQQINIIGRYSFRNFPINLEIPEDAIIVFQGGGNLGDLYRGPQKLREHVISKYLDHRIVVLPQTVYFQDKTKEAETLKRFGRHRHLQIFLRDEHSYRLLKEDLPHLHLSPDMAHYLWPIKPVVNPSKKVLYHLRTDLEINGECQPSLGNVADGFDWQTLMTKKERRMVRNHIQNHKGSKLTGDFIGVQRAWYQFSDDLMNKAIHYYSHYEQIITSRLHGHILACLMDKENVLIDNSYGKNSGYYLTWTHTVNTSRLKMDKKGIDPDV